MNHPLQHADLRLTSLVILLSFLCTGGCLHTTPAPPAPDATVKTAARNAVIMYVEQLAVSFEEASSQLQSGTLTTAEAVNHELQNCNAVARKRAFEQLDTVLNDELGGEKWDAARAQQLFQQIAAGLRSIQ